MGPRGGEHDREEIDRVVGRLKDIQEDAGNIIELAIDADPDWYMWGVLGMAGYAVYHGTAEQHYKHLHQMAETLALHVEALDASNQAYAAQEEGMMAALDKLGEKLDLPDSTTGGE